MQRPKTRLRAVAKRIEEPGMEIRGHSQPERFTLRWAAQLLQYRIHPKGEAEMNTLRISNRQLSLLNAIHKGSVPSINLLNGTTLSSILIHDWARMDGQEPELTKDGLEIWEMFHSGMAPTRVSPGPLCKRVLRYIQPQHKAKLLKFRRAA